MLTLYRRHNAAKCKHRSRTEKRCTCPIWVVGWLDGKKVPRKALKSRIWSEAEREVEKWHRDPEKQQKQERESLPVETAIAKYLANCKTERNAADPTLVSYTKTLSHLSRFLKSAGVVGLGAITISHIRDYLETRKDYKPRTRRKELEQIRFFFNYCHGCDWITKNPTKTEGKPLRVKVPKGGATQPLDDGEINTLLAACDQLKNNNMTWVPRARLRARALILGMCYTGLRISDIISLKRSEVRRNGRTPSHKLTRFHPLASLWAKMDC
jgi:integrase/recombinase XerD